MDSYLCFRLVLLHSVSYLFFLYQLPSLSLCTVFDSISSNIDEVLSINNQGEFKCPLKDFLTYFVGNDRPAELL